MNASSLSKSEETHFESSSRRAMSLSKEVIGITLGFMDPQTPHTLAGESLVTSNGVPDGDMLPNIGKRRLGSTRGSQFSTVRNARHQQRPSQQMEARPCWM